MAEIRVLTVQPIVDLRGANPAATWLNVGGAFSVWFDDVTGLFVVREGLANPSGTILTESDLVNVNGDTSIRVRDTAIPIGQAGAQQAYTSPAVTGAIAYSSYSFCEQISGEWYLNRFYINEIISFPFITRQRQINEETCNPTGTTCDLRIVNIISNGETAGLNDGSIVINATTNNTTLEYGLSPFEYGNGQTSNTFSGLTAGNYTIYMVDDKGCKVESSATILLNANNTYGDKYIVSYDDLNGNPARVRIQEKGYVGASTEITSSGNPVSYTNNEQDQFDPFTAINPARLVVSFPEVSKFLYRELFTQDNRKYRAIWEKDTGAGYSEIWRGFNNVGTSSAPYTFLPDISMTFVDGLALLDQKEFSACNDPDFGFPLKFESDIKLIILIASLLSDTDLDLPINVAINMYAGLHNTAATDDPLDQTFIDQENFYDDGEPNTFYEVLDKVLGGFGASIVQWSGSWWIIRQEEKTASFDYRTFDKNGEYVSNSSYNPVKNIKLASDTDARAVWSEQSGIYEIIPAYKTLNLTNTLGRRESLLENYDFIVPNSNNPYPKYWALYKGDTVGVNLIYNRRIKTGVIEIDRFVGSGDFNTTYIQAAQRNIEYTSNDKFLFKFDYAFDQIDKALPYLVIRARIKVGTYYLKENGEWTTTETFYRDYPTPSSGFSTISIEEDMPDVGGDTTLDVRLYTYHTSYTEDFANLSDFQNYPTTTLEVGSKIIAPNAVGVTGLDYDGFYTLESRDVAVSQPDVTPNDFDSLTNKKAWILKNQVDLANIVTNTRYFIRDVVFSILPNGAESPETEQINIDISENFTEDYTKEIFVGDVPRAGFSSAKYTYNGVLKYSDGTPTGAWSKTGETKTELLQYQLVTSLGAQFSTTTNKLSGSLTTVNSGTHLDITPIDCLVDTQDSDALYYINGLTIDDKNLLYEVNIIQQKGAVSDGGSSFDGGFSGGFGGGYDTIFN